MGCQTPHEPLQPEFSRINEWKKKKNFKMKQFASGAYE